MKCYCIANETDEGAEAVNGGKLYVKPCDIPESELTGVIEQINGLEIYLEDHWNCSAYNDNGIDDHSMSEKIESIEMDTVVLKDGEFYGVYIIPEKYVLTPGGKQTVCFNDEGRLGGWGDITTYIEGLIRPKTT